MSKRKKLNTDQMVTEYRASDGNIYVDLEKDGIVKSVRVDMLVAQAFVPNPEGKKNIHHLDGDPTNCRADNLIWVD